MLMKERLHNKMFCSLSDLNQRGSGLFYGFAGSRIRHRSATVPALRQTDAPAETVIRLLILSPLSSVSEK